MVICAAYGCSSRSGRDHVGFFNFPKDNALRKIWVLKLGRASNTSKSKTFVPNTYSKLCSLHFEDDQFEVSELLLKSINYTHRHKRRLKKDAIPSIFHYTEANKFRPSAQKIEEKRFKLQVLQKVSLETRDTAKETSSPDFDFDGPLTATPLHVFVNNESGLDTLATVAASQKYLPVQTNTTTSFNVQSQTPVWHNPSKETQFGPKLVSQETQTDWKNDVPRSIMKKVKIHLPSPATSANNSILSDIAEESFRTNSFDSDDTWIPSDSDITNEDIDEITGDEDRKFIVFESQLDKLLTMCSMCNNAMTIEKKVRGALLRCRRICNMCNYADDWSSQPCIGRVSLGHLQLSAAIMFSGNSLTKFLRALGSAGIMCFNEATYYNIQSAYLEPAVFHVWDEKQTEMMRNIRDREKQLRLAGDGRCCSPGHTAKYGTYSIMDLETGKILDLQLVQSNEVKSSHAMELEGLKRSLSFLMEENGLDVTHLVTDRHLSVKKYMRENHSNITHWFDVWHVAKGIYKKLEAAGKKKGCDKVKAWSRSVSNHLYWCAATSHGNGELVKQKWLSITNHVANIHEGHGSVFPKCEHKEIDKRFWMEKGCKPHAALEKIVHNKILVKDIKQLSPAEQTCELEAFHKVICSWVPKFSHYMHSAMEARSKIAAMHFNENTRRKCSIRKDGKKKYSISYPKGRKGDAVVKEVKSEQTFDYIKDLMKAVLDMREKHTSYKIAKEVRRAEERYRPSPLAQSTPKRHKKSKQELIDSHVSRFNK